MRHVDTVRKLVEHFGDEVPVVAFVFGPLGTLSIMRKQEETYMDIYDEPEAVKAAAACMIHNCGGFVLATGCEYPLDADSKRAHLMQELAKTYGSYEK